LNLDFNLNQRLNQSSPAIITDLERKFYDVLEKQKVQMRNESQDSDVVSLYPLMQGYKRLSTQALARKAVHDQKHILNVSVD